MATTNPLIIEGLKLGAELIKGPNVRIDFLVHGKAICSLKNASLIGGLKPSLRAEEEREKAFTMDRAYTRTTGPEVAALMRNNYFPDKKGKTISIRQGTTKIACMSPTDEFMDWLERSVGGRQHDGGISMILHDQGRRVRQTVGFENVTVQTVSFLRSDRKMNTPSGIVVKFLSAITEGSMTPHGLNPVVPSGRTWLASDFSVDIDGIESTKWIEAVDEVTLNHADPAGASTVPIFIPAARGEEFMKWHAEATRPNRPAQSRSGSIAYLSKSARPIARLDLTNIVPSRVMTTGGTLRIDLRCDSLEMSH